MFDVEHVHRLRGTTVLVVWTRLKISHEQSNSRVSSKLSMMQSLEVVVRLNGLLVMISHVLIFNYCIAL